LLELLFLARAGRRDVLQARAGFYVLLLVDRAGSESTRRKFPPGAARRRQEGARRHGDADPS